ncbi:hypothetical protein yaldo0001_11580 [Yersinia aldovae ATCC 35236]|nr:hypothetical protein yaldo0001_11580 [Yersinia aldovae ATCC 35236]
MRIFFVCRLLHKQAVAEFCAISLLIMIIDFIIIAHLI